jgi:uncharacterized protein (TIGR00725 family)
VPISTADRVVRRPIIGVMGSGAEGHEALAVPLGRWIARQGFHLLTGGGGGVMEAVGRAFTGVANRAGLSIGVLKGQPEPDGRVRGATPNPWVEVPIRTHLPLSGADGTDARSRNHINVLTADVVVALPGGDGTRSEVVLALRYGRPVVAFVGGPAPPPGWPRVPAAASLDELAALVAPALRRSVS